jgi:hypothetical protein
MAIEVVGVVMKLVTANIDCCLPWPCQRWFGRKGSAKFGFLSGHQLLICLNHKEDNHILIFCEFQEAVAQICHKNTN